MTNYVSKNMSALTSILSLRERKTAQPRVRVKALPTPKLALIALSLSISSNVVAGDAVAIGFNKDGIWTAVTYYNSSTPVGGKDYKNVADARKEALRDLRARAGQGLARASILASSDSTGFAAVARGKTGAGKEVNVVGYGKSQNDADEKALRQLKEGGATENQKVIYRYFSYGADSLE
jgi:hypothetical protein